MNDKIKISDYYILLKKDIAEKINNQIEWIENKEEGCLIFYYEGIKFTKSLNNILDNNYCYLNDGIKTKCNTEIFETKNCLIAFIIAMYY